MAKPDLFFDQIYLSSFSLHTEDPHSSPAPPSALFMPPLLIRAVAGRRPSLPLPAGGAVAVCVSSSASAAGGGGGLRCPTQEIVLGRVDWVLIISFVVVFPQLDILCNEEILGKDHTLKFVVVTRWRFKVSPGQVWMSSALERSRGHRLLPRPPPVSAPPPTRSEIQPLHSLLFHS